MHVLISVNTLGTARCVCVLYDVFSTYTHFGHTPFYNLIHMAIDEQLRPSHCAWILQVLRISNLLPFKPFLQTVKPIQHRLERIWETLPKRWIRSIRQVVLKDVCGPSGITRRRTAVRSMQCPSFHLRVVFPNVYCSISSLEVYEAVLT